MKYNRYITAMNTMMQIMIVLILPEIKRLRTHDTHLICMEGMKVENYFNVIDFTRHWRILECEGDTFLVAR